MTRLNLAFVGLLLPEGAERDNPAFSQAGALFQRRLLASLARAGVRVGEVIAQRPVPSFPAWKRLLFGPLREDASASRAGAPVVYVPFLNLGPLKTLTSAVSSCMALVRWAGSQGSRPRAIVQYNLTSPPILASVAAGWLTRTPVVAIVADIQVPGSGSVPRTFARRAEYWLHTRSMSLCDGLVVLTQRMARDFAPDVPRMLLEGAIPQDMLHGAGEPREAPADGTRVLMYAGELSDLKGVPALLDAFAQLSDPQLRLWITGRGPAQEQVEAAAARDPRITFWGYPPYERVLALYARATLLVNPHSASHASSRYLFPSKLLEYLATGTPVVTTSSTPEVVSEYGSVVVLACNDSPTALAAAITEALSLPPAELTELGARARALIARRKTWERQGRCVAEFVASIAAARS